MPPLNTWEAPGTSVIRLAIRPPVQLSAQPSVNRLTFRPSSTTYSREGTSAVDQGAEQGLDLLHRGQKQGLGLLLGSGLGGDPQLTFALLGVGGQGGVLHGIHLLSELGLHLGLADAEQLQGVGGDDPLAELL